MVAGGRLRMNTYMVTMETSEHFKVRTLCKDKMELIVLLANLADEYRVISVDTVENCEWSWREFCTKNKDLELGGK